MPYIKNIFLVFLLMEISGCSYLKTIVGLGPKRPKINIEEVNFVSLNHKTLKLKLRLKIYNPNDFNLELSNASYRVSSEGKSFAEGNHRKELIAVKKAYSLITLPISIDLKTTGALLKTALISGKKPLVKWYVEAEFNGPLGPIGVEFEDEKALY
jgi:LEA14-like dessication related protein